MILISRNDNCGHQLMISKCLYSIKNILCSFYPSNNKWFFLQSVSYAIYSWIVLSNKYVISVMCLLAWLEDFNFLWSWSLIFHKKINKITKKLLPESHILASLCCLYFLLFLNVYQYFNFLNDRYAIFIIIYIKVYIHVIVKEKRQWL